MKTREIIKNKFKSKIDIKKKKLKIIESFFIVFLNENHWRKLNLMIRGIFSHKKNLPIIFIKLLFRTNCLKNLKFKKYVPHCKKITIKHDLKVLKNNVNKQTNAFQLKMPKYKKIQNKIRIY